MGAVFSKKGLNYLLRKITGHEPQGDLVLHLYINNYIPNENSALKSFDEVNGAGYAPKIMWGVMWDEKTTYFENTEIFEFGDVIKKFSVYGYYATGRGQLIFAERFDDGPYKIQIKGDKVEVKVRMEIR